MSSPAVQLTFALRTSTNVQSVHLVGSWDGYKSQLPLSTVKDAGARPGSWKGVFRFQGTHALKLGSRYWYYYICDGYHVSHDPAKEFITEKTTGRKLNILDVPPDKSPPHKATSATTKVKETGRHGRQVPQGRPISPSRIACPKPSKPYASRQLREADYGSSPIDAMDEMAQKFTMSARISERPPMNYNSSDVSDNSSASGRSFSSVSGSSSSSPSSSLSSSPSSSLSSSPSVDECTCQRFGITRDGRRVKLDCGGAKCGYTKESDCSDSDSDSESESEDERPAPQRQTRHAAPAPVPKKVPPFQVSRHAAPVASRRRH